MIKIGLCVDPQNKSAKGISDKAMRAITPERGKNQKDIEHRSKARLKILQHIVPKDMIDYRSVLPYKLSSTAMEDPTGLLVPEKDLKKMGDKFIRGITFVIDGLYIEHDHYIEINFPHELNTFSINPLLEEHGIEYNCGPGINILRASAPDDLQSGIYYIEIWDMWFLYGFVNPIS